MVTVSPAAVGDNENSEEGVAVYDDETEDDDEFIADDDDEDYITEEEMSCSKCNHEANKSLQFILFPVSLMLKLWIELDGLSKYLNIMPYIQ